MSNKNLSAGVDMKAILIRTRDGMAYGSFVRVCDFSRITKGEFELICLDMSEDFTRIEKPC